MTNPWPHLRTFKKLLCHSSEFKVLNNKWVDMCFYENQCNTLQESVSLALLTWLETDVEERKQHAGRLLNHVIWRRLPAPFLLKVLLRHPIITTDSAIKQLVLDHVRRSYDDQDRGMELMSSVLDGDPGENTVMRGNQLLGSYSNVTPNYRNFRPRNTPHQAILLVGGLTLGEAERGDTTQPNVMCYHPMQRVWKNRSSWPERGLRGFSVAKYDGGVAVTGNTSKVICSEVRSHSEKVNYWLIVPFYKFQPHLMDSKTFLTSRILARLWVFFVMYGISNVLSTFVIITEFTRCLKDLFLLHTKKNTEFERW